MSNFAYLCVNNGEQGFPFRITNGSTNASHPFTQSLGVLLSMYWGVKLWSLSTDFTMTDSGGGVFACFNGTIPQVALMPTRKEELIIGSNLQTAQQGAWSATDANSGVGLNMFNDGAGGRVIRAGSALYPFFNASAGIGTFPANFVQLNSINGGGFPLAVTGKITIGSTTMTYPMYADVGGGPPDPTYNVSKFELSPASGW